MSDSDEMRSLIIRLAAIVDIMTPALAKIADDDTVDTIGRNRMIARDAIGMAVPLMMNTKARVRDATKQTEQEDEAKLS